MGIQDEIIRLQAGKDALKDALGVTEDILLYTTSEEDEDIVKKVIEEFNIRDNYLNTLKYCEGESLAILGGIAAMEEFNERNKEE